MQYNLQYVQPLAGIVILLSSKLFKDKYYETTLY